MRARLGELWAWVTPLSVPLALMGLLPPTVRALARPRDDPTSTAPTPSASRPSPATPHRLDRAGADSVGPAGSVLFSSGATTGGQILDLGRGQSFLLEQGLDDAVEGVALAFKNGQGLAVGIV